MSDTVGYLGSQAKAIRVTSFFFSLKPACNNVPSACNSLSRIDEGQTDGVPDQVHQIGYTVSFGGRKKDVLGYLA